MYDQCYLIRKIKSFKIQLQKHIKMYNSQTVEINKKKNIFQKANVYKQSTEG